MSRIIVGDVHGCFKTFLALKKKFPKNIPITFVGDLIDRGPLDQKMVQYVMDNQDFCDCVLGNHSHYCCDYYQKTKIYLPNTWTMNGGTCMTFTDAQIEWMSNLPRAIEYEDEVNADNRTLLVSHTCIEHSIEHFVNLPVDEAIFTRGLPADLQTHFHVFGHTPIVYDFFGMALLEGMAPRSKSIQGYKHNVNRPIVMNYFANIDTGCAIGYMMKTPAFLTAIQFPEMDIYQQECID